uniref:Jacalin-type lectin domain-containing protein n=1 Tax=Octactis speculum TaxID=3111310 RepID=A0A7S2BWP0_9STRA|mmetsp:Transcript_27717/g.37949  ORF Transcript_27717/g.37949 Transcript_27717/m.37949 type:complete len:201 (+) Transcript_27717:333-935(+)
MVIVWEADGCITGIQSVWKVSLGSSEMIGSCQGDQGFPLVVRGAIHCGRQEERGGSFVGMNQSTVEPSPQRLVLEDGEDIVAFSGRCDDTCVYQITLTTSNGRVCCLGSKARSAAGVSFTAPSDRQVCLAGFVGAYDPLAIHTIGPLWTSPRGSGQGELQAPNSLPSMLSFRPIGRGEPEAVDDTRDGGGGDDEEMVCPV